MLTQKRLKELLHYDPETGIFTWRAKRSGVIRGNMVAGGVNGAGYIHIKIQGKSHKAHRLAFLYMEGYFPEYHVDHKYGIKDDNRWSEISHVTRACNLQNSKLYSSNSSGFSGVNWNKRSKRWLSWAMLNGQSISLGYHPTALDAALARLTWEMQCSKWTCNHRSELVIAIKKAWPEFKIQMENN